MDGTFEDRLCIPKHVGDCRNMWRLSERKPPKIQMCLAAPSLTQVMMRFCQNDYQNGSMLDLVNLGECGDCSVSDTYQEYLALLKHTCSTRTDK